MQKKGPWVSQSSSQCFCFQLPGSPLDKMSVIKKGEKTQNTSIYKDHYNNTEPYWKGELSLLWKRQNIRQLKSACISRRKFFQKPLKPWPHHCRFISVPDWISKRMENAQTQTRTYSNRVTLPKHHHHLPPPVFELQARQWIPHVVGIYWVPNHKCPHWGDSRRPGLQYSLGIQFQCPKFNPLISFSS